MKAVFIDKDGTLIENIPYNADPGRIRFLPGALAGVGLFKKFGFAVVIVSNQSGVAYGFFPERALDRIHKRIEAVLAGKGLSLDGFYFCPHAPDGVVAGYAVPCGCRKPAPGLLLRAAADLGLSIADSWMMGDILDDIEAGRRAGCRTVLIDNGNETEWRAGPDRTPHLVARSLEEAARLVCFKTPGVLPREARG